MPLSKKTPTQLKKRTLKVYSKAFPRDNGHYVFFPFISLSGKWLKDCGFEIGEAIEIRIEEGRVVIAPTKT